MHTIVLVDDHPMIRRALAAYLEETGGFTVLGEASSLDEAHILFKGLVDHESVELPDLVLLDIGLEDENGLDLIPWLQNLCGSAKGHGTENKLPKAVVFSMWDDPFRIQHAIHLGARGYVSKNANESEIVVALEAVIHGDLYIDNRLQGKMTEIGDIYAGLTGRERGIMELIQKNYDNRGIARELNLKLKTVENYISRIYTKTGTASRGDLCRL
ncbi:DNA-binding response regulator [Spirochaetia bacterium]|nr:DNA-binding response regulator [Spirochaetia bacterium]